MSCNNNSKEIYKKVKELEAQEDFNQSIVLLSR